MAKLTTALRCRTMAAGLLLATGLIAPAMAQDVTVTFWNNWDGTRASQLRGVLDAFEVANPGIKVDNVTLTGGTSAQRMLAAVAAGDVPDLYMTGTNNVSQWANLGALRPIDDYVARDQYDLSGIFFDSSIEGSRFDGQLVQLPFKIPTTMAIWYNRELFEAAGLDPDDPPDSWSELEAAAAALTKREGDVITQLGLNICVSCTNTAEQPFYELLSRNNGRLLNAEATDVAFDGPEGVATLQWMVDFSQNSAGGWQNAVNQFGATYAEVRPSFYQGKLAMIMDGPYLYNIMRAEAPDMLEKIGVFLIPTNDGNPDAEQRFLAFGVPGYGIPAGAKNPDQAWELLKFIAGDLEGGCAFFQLQGRPDSPIRGCDGGLAPAINDVLVENAAIVQAAVSPPTFPQVHQRVQQMVESALVGNASPADAIASAARDIRAILAGN